MRFTRLNAALAVLTVLVWRPQSAGALDLNGVFREVAAANPTLAARREMVEAARRPGHGRRRWSSWERSMSPSAVGSTWIP